MGSHFKSEIGATHPFKGKYALEDPDDESDISSSDNESSQSESSEVD